MTSFSILLSRFKVEGKRKWWKVLFSAFCVTIPLIVISILLSRKTYFKLIRFNFKGAETEFVEDKKFVLLDYEAREIVYLILASGVKTIIFEDLDRFENISFLMKQIMEKGAKNPFPYYNRDRKNFYLSLTSCSLQLVRIFLFPDWFVLKESYKQFLGFCVHRQ